MQGGGWTLAESRVYLVELSTTPAALGHVAPYRHDYRKAREAYKQGDVVILEGVRPGSQDVGVVRRVLLGVKADKVLACLSHGDGVPREAGDRRKNAVASTTTFRVTRRLWEAGNHWVLGTTDDRMINAHPRTIMRTHIGGGHKLGHSKARRPFSGRAFFV